MTLLQDMGYTVREEDVTITEALQADEVFTTGTAVVISSVGSLTYHGMHQSSIGCCIQPYLSASITLGHRVRNHRQRHAGAKTEFCNATVGPVTSKVYDKLTGIQSLQDADPRGWVVPVR